MNIIEKYKEKTGLNNRQLAEALGKSERQVYRWLSGERIPRHIEIMLQDKLTIKDLYKQIESYRELLKSKLNKKE